jgi:hypothetical protein
VTHAVHVVNLVLLNFAQVMKLNLSGNFINFQWKMPMLKVIVRFQVCNKGLHGIKVILLMAVQKRFRNTDNGLLRVTEKYTVIFIQSK